MTIRLLTAVAVCLAGLGLVAAEAADKKPIQRDLSKDFDELTPSEQIAIRAAAKAAYKAKKLKMLNVCADPGNMPLSNIKGEGFQNKIATLLGDGDGRARRLPWRALHRARPDAGRPSTRRMCDVMFDMPMNYGRLLTTFPVYKTTYVLAYPQRQGPQHHRPRRSQAQGSEDRRVPDLGHPRGARQARHRRQRLSCQTQTHDADLVVEHQPWWTSCSAC